jgi:hypothetical protein
VAPRHPLTAAPGDGDYDYDYERPGLLAKDTTEACAGPGSPGGGRRPIQTVDRNRAAVTNQPDQEVFVGKLLAWRPEALHEGVRGRKARETPRAASPDTGNNPCGLSAMVSGPSRQRRDPRGRYDREKKEPQSTGRERGPNSSEKRASNLGVRAMVPSSTQGTTRAEQDSADDTSCGDGGRHGHGRNARRRWGAYAHKTQHARLSRPASPGGDCTN